MSRNISKPATGPSKDRDQVPCLMNANASTADTEKKILMDLH